jgi:hypothetical protein
MAENGRMTVHNGIVIVASRQVRQGDIRPHQAVPGVWMVHSLEDFRYLWDREAMRVMGIRWNREDARLPDEEK